MSTVVADVSMSLDGYITGPEPSTRSGLGRSGDALHQWVFAQDSPRDHQLLEEAGARTGAAVVGRNTFDFVDGPNGWNGEAVIMGGALVTQHATHLTYRLYED